MTAAVKRYSITRCVVMLLADQLAKAAACCPTLHGMSEYIFTTYCGRDGGLAPRAKYVLL